MPGTAVGVACTLQKYRVLSQISRNDAFEALDNHSIAPVYICEALLHRVMLQSLLARLSAEDRIRSWNGSVPQKISLHELNMTPSSSYKVGSIYNLVLLSRLSN